MNIQFIRLGLIDEGGNLYSKDNPMPRSKFIPTGSDHESSDHDLSPEVKNQSPEVKKSIPEVMPSSEVQPEFRPVLPSRSSIRRSGATSRGSLVSPRKSLAPSSDGASTDSFHDYPSSSAKYYSTSAKVVWIFFACWPVRSCPRSPTSAQNKLVRFGLINGDGGRDHFKQLVMHQLIRWKQWPF